ncbi:hypothetical protein [Rhodococcoides kroppenstedtii]|uniref:hypothetical protein n=1 Tax=Rhodococcoides kroppenstedtii TaxID=293050 RepID=UPI001BDDD7D1|nr:hypothetical protein [Rhodococcus kroppenstedtii]MBT1191093.1 hypothetical protein [Rhodococcus kroppenstedtii]
MIVRAKTALPQALLVSAVMLAALAAFKFGRVPVAEIHSMLQDDAFYYLQIAKNLGLHGASSFNLLVSTNGYHPLWLSYLTMFYLLTGGTGIEAFVIVTVMLSAAAFFTLTGKFLQQMGTSAYWSKVGGLGSSVVFIWLARTGMEVVLTLPLSLWLGLIIARGHVSSRPKSAFLAGLASSAVVLSRLDAAILVALMIGAYFGATFFLKREEIRRSALLAYCVGVTPILAYFVCNLVFFGTLLPVSGQAKQLNSGLNWSSRTFVSLLSPSGIQMPVWGAALLVLIGITIAVAAMYWSVKSRVFSPAEMSVLFGMIFFPVVYYVYLSTASDWKIWPWYRYPLLLTFLAVTAAVTTLPGRRIVVMASLRIRAATYAVLSMILVIAGFVLGNKQPNAPIVRIGERLSEFQTDHQGIYAMGDAAGTFGYYSTQPIVHLEGLVMDKDFLENIASQRDAVEVMREYNVSFYVGNNLRESNGCFEVVEPKQGGDKSRKMTGILCKQPMLSFSEGSYSIKVFKLQ